MRLVRVDNYDEVTFWSLISGHFPGQLEIFFFVQQSPEAAAGIVSVSVLCFEQRDKLEYLRFVLITFSIYMTCMHLKLMHDHTHILNYS